MNFIPVISTWECSTIYPAILISTNDLIIMVIRSMVGINPDPEYKMTSRLEKKTVSYVKGTDLDWCLNHLIL